MQATRPGTIRPQCGSRRHVMKLRSAMRFSPKKIKVHDKRVVAQPTPVVESADRLLSQTVIVNRDGANGLPGADSQERTLEADSSGSLH